MSDLEAMTQEIQSVSFPAEAAPELRAALREHIQFLQVQVLKQRGNAEARAILARRCEVTGYILEQLPPT